MSTVYTVQLANHVIFIVNNSSIYNNIDKYRGGGGGIIYIELNLNVYTVNVEY